MKASKLKINVTTIAELNPCKDRLDNYLRYYKDKSFNLRQFLSLDKITHQDKLWVILRLVDDDTRVVFALDCAFNAYSDAVYAYAYATANAAAVYAYADAYAAVANAAANADAYAAVAYSDVYSTPYAATYVARKREQDRQIESLVYLIEGPGAGR